MVVDHMAAVCSWRNLLGRTALALLVVANCTPVCSSYDFPLAEKQAAQGKTVLVTGAAGFVGSHVAQHCADIGFTVLAVDDLSGGFMANVPTHPSVTFVKGDLRDAYFVQSLFLNHGKITFVYHLAAYAAEGLSHFIRSYNYRTNLVATMEILNQAIKHKVECFVFTSSIAVYGSINDLSQMQNPNRTLHTDKSKGTALTEEDRPSPEDPYGISKFACEMDLKAAKELWGMDFVIFRPHNVYGPHQNMFDKYRNVVGIFINQIYHQKPMSIFGNGQQERAFSYIDDVAPVIARGPLLPEARNQVFNIGADTPYTVEVLAKEIAIAMGKGNGYPIDKQPARLEVFSAVASHAKVHKYFNPPPTVDLREGLRRTVEWYNAKGQTFAPVEFAAVEVLSRMPPSWVRSDLREEAMVTGSRVKTEAMDADLVATKASNSAMADKRLSEAWCMWNPSACEDSSRSMVLVLAVSCSILLAGGWQIWSRLGKAAVDKRRAPDVV